MSRIFTIQCSDADIHTAVTPISSENGMDIYSLRITLPRKMSPPTITIAWEEDMCNILHVWHPLTGTHHAMHQWWAPTTSRSCFHYGAPMLATIGDGAINRETIALSDPITPMSLHFCIKDIDQKNKVGYSVALFNGTCDDIDSYETLLRIDTRPLPFCEVIQQVYPWWAKHGYAIPAPPAAAEDALYSSWYNFHQAPDQARLLNELKIAAELGFKTVILDDGWQFSGPSSGDYSSCGEWKMSEDKFPDFKAFTDAVHALGMKVMVWFGVPFIGINSPLFEVFKGKYLSVTYGTMNEGTLDPRYPEVRAHIISAYCRFLTDYDIDGFKLDFIDAFMPHPETPAYDPAVMDCETVGEAVLRLLTEITEQLNSIKPDLLYEYRQNYVGPAINRFGNMLRVGDCAYESHTNRVGIVDLRLLGYPVAVHADMLFWAPEESVKLCARQLINIMFAVPQISVILAESTEEQKALLQAYLSYWTKNRALLLHGTFRAMYPEQNYPYISAHDDSRAIVTLHGDLPYVYNGLACDIHHNGDIDGIVFENPTDASLVAEISAFFGAKPLGTVTVPPHTITRLPVPQTGMVRVRAISGKN